MVTCVHFVVDFTIVRLDIFRAQDVVDAEIKASLIILQTDA